MPCPGADGGKRMDLAAIAELDRRLEIPGSARIVAGNGGLAKVLIASPDAAGEMYLHGAHVTSWQPRGAGEVLFVSSKARWEDGGAIRGGVPVCFPWFGSKADDPRAPAHGFVRTKAWQLESIVRAGDAVTVSMFTESSAETKRGWPADFHLVHRATFGSELTQLPQFGPFFDNSVPVSGRKSFIGPASLSKRRCSANLPS